MSGDRSSTLRLATVVVEQTLGTATGTPAPADTFSLATSIAPASVRTPPAIAHPQAARDPQSAIRLENSFVIPSPDGGVLVEAEVSQQDLQSARELWTRGVRAAVIAVVGVTRCCCAPGRPWNCGGGRPMPESSARHRRGRGDAAGRARDVLDGHGCGRRCAGGRISARSSADAH